MIVTLKKKRIVDSWSALIEAGAGQHLWFMNTVINRLFAVKPPNTTWQKVDVVPGLLRSFSAKNKRDYLLVTNSTLPDHRMFIRAADFGNQLEVSWLLTIDPLLPKRMVSRFLTGSSQAMSGGRSFYKQQAISGYITTVRQTVLETVKQL